MEKIVQIGGLVNNEGPGAKTLVRGGSGAKQMFAVRTIAATTQIFLKSIMIVTCASVDKLDHLLYCS